jgi:hypothetical protein
MQQGDVMPAAVSSDAAGELQGCNTTAAAAAAAAFIMKQQGWPQQQQMQQALSCLLPFE